MADILTLCLASRWFSFVCCKLCLNIHLFLNRGTSSGSKEDIWKMGESFSSESKSDFIHCNLLSVSNNTTCKWVIIDRA